MTEIDDEIDVGNSICFKNGSVIYVTTGNDFNKVEGKSIKNIVLEEDYNGST